MYKLICKALISVIIDGVELFLLFTCTGMEGTITLADEELHKFVIRDFELFIEKRKLVYLFFPQLFLFVVI